jgi:hypothetical protein
MTKMSVPQGTPIMKRWDVSQEGPETQQTLSILTCDVPPVLGQGDKIMKVSAAEEAQEGKRRII